MSSDLKSKDYEIQQLKLKVQEGSSTTVDQTNNKDKTIKSLQQKVALALNQKKVQEADSDLLKKRLSDMMTTLEKNEKRDNHVFEHFMGHAP